MAKTTKKDFDVFKAECQKWIDYFGLKDWEIHYILDDDDENLGSCTANIGSMHATVRFAKEWDEVFPHTPYEIKKTAFHEIIEGVFFCQLRIFAESRAFDQAIFDSEMHKVVHALENSLFDEHWKRRKGKK